MNRKIENLVGNLNFLVPDRLLFWLIGIDLIFITMHMVGFTRFSQGERFSLAAEFGYSEYFQYAKETITCAILFSIFLKRKTLVFAAWSLLLLYLLIDDSCQLHERFGNSLAPFIPNFLTTLLHVGRQPVAELLFAGFVGVILMTVIFYFHLKSNRENRLFSLHYFIMICALSFFGVIIDLLHMVAANLTSNSFVLKTFAIVEDGGELLVMTSILWYSTMLWNHITLNAPNPQSQSKAINVDLPI